MSQVMPTYFNRLSVGFDHGKGAWLWDTNGEKYLDALAGIAVCSLGHAHPKITAAICEQAAKVIHTHNTYQIPHQEALATELTSIAGMEQVYFANSGAEANETAIKLTRMWARKKNIAEPLVVTIKNSFHGRTFATLCASGTERLQQGFEPLMPGFIHVDLNDIEVLENIAKTNPNLVAIMIEPIQGDGGIALADNQYLEAVRALCDKYDCLMILDEIQTGMGRTGKWFAYQHTSIVPDIITVAKALANGIPVGACLARGKACNLFGPGKHGSTFGGNPFVCAVGLAVIKTMKEENILKNAQEMGDYLQSELKKQLASLASVVAVRGKGLMIGVELNRTCMPILPIGMENRLLFNVTANKVIRLLPPLIINREEADEIVRRLVLTIKMFDES
jgi:acetylornithine/N-succinyldiaminopimelate aminotransferase